MTNAHLLFINRCYIGIVWSIKLPPSSDHDDYLNKHNTWGVPSLQHIMDILNHLWWWSIFEQRWHMSGTIISVCYGHTLLKMMFNNTAPTIINHSHTRIEPSLSFASVFRINTRYYLGEDFDRNQYDLSSRSTGGSIWRSSAFTYFMSPFCVLFFFPMRSAGPSGRASLPHIIR
jgi:hypothetical protein